VNQILYRKLRNKIDYCRDTYRYSLKSDTPELEFEEPNKSNLIDDILESWKTDEASSTFQHFFKEKYFKVNTGNEKLDYLIKTIVKDNTITECEEVFLKQKAKELGVEENLIDYARKSLHSNNPYLDNLMHIIFEDGLITNTELDFIKEKCIELNFTKTFVNKRFWVIGITFYTDYLRAIEGFDRLVSLFFLARKISFPKLNNDLWILTKLNIFQTKPISIIIENGLKEITNELLNYLQNNINYVLKNSELKNHFKTQEKYTGSKIEIKGDYDSALIEIENSLRSDNSIPKEDNFSLNQNKIESTLINFEEENQAVIINNMKFHIKRKKTPYLPLFYFNFNADNGQNQVFLNTGHKKYCGATENLVIEFACSVYYTKQTMTSRDTDIFIERFHNNLQLIE
jgi:hypothetical protein